jgi:hypothetical protein
MSYKDFQAGVAELADAPDLGSDVATRVGSSPSTRTNAAFAMHFVYFN